MIIFLHGSDTFRSRQKLKFYREGFKKKYDPRGLNIEVLEGEKFSLEDFRNKLMSQGLLSKKKLVIVEELISKNKGKKILDETAKFLKDNSLSKDDVLIFWEGDLAGGRKKGKKVKEAKGKLITYLKEKARTESFKFLNIPKLNNWVVSEFRKRKGRIEKKAQDLLIALVGNDLWQMNNEIEKLINYKNGKVVTEKDVSEFVKARFDTDIFKLSDAMAERKLKQALKLIHDQIESGESELYLLAMLTRQFRILLQVKEVAKEEKNYYTIASRLSLHPFVAQKSINQVRNFSISELKKIYRQLLDIDLKIKTSQANSKLLFDLFIFDVCKA